MDGELKQFLFMSPKDKKKQVNIINNEFEFFTSE